MQALGLLLKLLPFRRDNHQPSAEPTSAHSAGPTAHSTAREQQQLEVSVAAFLVQSFHCFMWQQSSPISEKQMEQSH